MAPKTLLLPFMLQSLDNPCIPFCCLFFIAEKKAFSATCIFHRILQRNSFSLHSTEHPPDAADGLPLPLAQRRPVGIEGEVKALGEVALDEVAKAARPHNFPDKKTKCEN